MLRPLFAAMFAFTGILPAQKVDFGRDIRPLFQESCVGCHGPTQQMAGMRLDRRSSAMRIRGGTIIGPGNADGSILYRKLTGDKYGGQMPPTGPLKPEQVALVKAWIDQGAVWPDDLAGEKPPALPDPRAVRLMNGIRSGDFSRLLREDPEAVNLKGPGGSTPLMYAALYGDAASVQQFIEKGANVNASNDAGATALMWAVDDADKVRLLLDHGADPNAKSIDDRTALAIAVAKRGSAPVVKLLLDHGARIGGKAATEPSPFAGAGGDEAVLRMLLEHGATRPAAALGPAVRSDCPACVDLLLPSVPKGAISRLAIQMGGSRDLRTLQILLDHGADVKASEAGLGFTSLMYAADAEAGALERVNLLIGNGADVNTRSADGTTALDFALRSGNPAVIEALRKAGAKPGDAVPAPSLKPKPAASARAALERSIPLLQRNDVMFMKKSGCVSCHNNNLTAMTITRARKQGLAVDDGIARAQVKSIAAYIEDNREHYLQNVPVAGGTDTASYILLGLAAESWPSDPATDAMARFIMSSQRADGCWPTFGGRPPIESSDIQNTATAMRAIQVYMVKPRRAAYEHSVQLAADWLAKAKVLTTEDRVFQILGMVWAGREEFARTLARDLLKEQRADGGWSQTPMLQSDAYATGQAMVALKEAGVLTDGAQQRGARFLLTTQMEDGSWFVRSRTIPFQPYFDAGFPYGPDQFISAAATNWASMALIPLAH